VLIRNPRKPKETNSTTHVASEISLISANRNNICPSNHGDLQNETTIKPNVEDHQSYIPRMFYSDWFQCLARKED
jgi:hypothetical protein